VRFMVPLVSATALASAFPATSQIVTDEARRSAYEAALKCFVANGSAYGDAQKAGDAAEAAAFDAKARASFDAAVRLGELLGYSGTRVEQDFRLTQMRELPQIVSNPAYARQSLQTCKALGLA